jgi:hypothetical protein
VSAGTESMTSARQNLQVVVVADDPIEAGMIALDLVQAGLAAHAVRDEPSAVQQLHELLQTRPGAQLVAVAVFRELTQAASLWQTLQAWSSSVQVGAPGFVAVVLRSQRESATRFLQEGWSGVAVRPVNADELVQLVSAAAPHIGGDGVLARNGELHQEGLLDVLHALVERIPRPGSGKNALLRAESFGRFGQIVVFDGELIHADVAGEVGRHALERMACWHHGSWSLEPLPADGAAWPTAPTLTGSSLGLIAVASEYARRVEEVRQNLPYTDCVCSVRWERVRPLPVVAEEMFRRIATGVVLTEALAGEGDDELEAFAALEARIKRGAVVPQIETAGAAPAVVSLPRTLPVGHASTVVQAAPVGVTTLQTLPAAAAGHATSGRPVSNFSAVPMQMVDAPQMPERRRSHPTTHLYRVGGEVPSTGPAEEVEEVQPPQLPPPAARHSPSQHLGYGQNASPSVPGQRGGVVTGWFGTGEDQGGEIAQPMSHRHASSEARELLTAAAGHRRSNTPQTGGRLQQAGASARISQAIVAGAEQGQRLAARPYAWSPSQVAPVDPAADAPLPPLPSAMREALPWVIASLAIAAALAFALWPRAQGEAELQPHPSSKAYKRAVSWIDSGHDAEAVAELQKLVDDKQAGPEAVLQLGVMQVQLRQFDGARRNLEAYLRHPLALHRERALRLYKHVYGAEPGAPAATAAGPSAG